VIRRGRHRSGVRFINQRGKQLIGRPMPQKGCALPGPKINEMAPPLHQRTQAPLHQLGKDLPRQTRSPIRPRTVGQGSLKQLEQVFGQRAGAAHEVKDQGGQQLCQGHAGFAPARTVSTARQRLERFGGDQLTQRRQETAGVRIAVGRAGRILGDRRFFYSCDFGRGGFLRVVMAGAGGTRRRSKKSRRRSKTVHSTVSPLEKSKALATAAGKFTYHCWERRRWMSWTVVGYGIPEMYLC